jgi:hypothetical protein
MDNSIFDIPVYNKSIHRSDGKNPGFYCRDYIETNSHVRTPVCACKEQCQECINAVIEHHSKKVIQVKG